VEARFQCVRISTRAGMAGTLAPVVLTVDETICEEI
jgi:hypothetical protein